MHKTSAPRQIVVSFRTDQQTLEELERLLDRDRLTRTQLIKRALMAYDLMYPGPHYKPPGTT